ncbi:Rho GTPase activation protein [Metschnikowia bicuspidata]|uniref:Rho GTPase activation protein n=1 Tax=Metschnikowia bicuspidata TaxID=27322 RepID=A0A4P9ZEF0_9ASCO|nr:Rho GTPase activation protein [Metschnikowia bicuspidata]
MAKNTVFHTSLIQHKGLFSDHNIHVSADKSAWAYFRIVSVNDDGTVVGETELGQVSVLALAIQSCSVQIVPSAAISPSNKRRHALMKSNGSAAPVEDPPLIAIRTVSNECLYFRVYSKSAFCNLLLCLLAWQNLRPAGLAKKWFAENKVHPSTFSDPHELLVCRFKLYGPVPLRTKNIHLIPGLPAPAFGIVKDVTRTSSSISISDHSIQEGWFYAMGALKSNGMLNFITELDGTLLYSIDIKNLFLSEIREVHTSICNSANILFLGHIHELRLINVSKTTSAATPETVAAEPFLLKDSKPVSNNLRVLIEFPLHIDLEDWFVGLNYFCRREYIGIYNSNSKERDSIPTRVLRKFSRDHLRIAKKVALDIIEAKFDNVAPGDGKIYAEVIMCGLPWGRTALVNHTANPFWKEEFSTDLPILTQMIRIVIKKTYGHVHDLAVDTIIGSVYLTPDILGGQLPKYSTMISNPANGEEIVVSGTTPAAEEAERIAVGSSKIIRLSIFESGHIPIGKLLLTVSLKEHHIPPAQAFRNLEAMLVDCPMKELILYCNSTVGATEFQTVSFVLLDVFQSLGVEEKWFKALMDVELANVNEATRKNYTNKSASAPQNMNVVNTLFRGSSIFTKSLEKYLFRVGQEYLEKVFGDFFDKLIEENKNCELDPRYIRIYIKSQQAGVSDSDDLSAVSDETPEDEAKREQQVQEIVSQNYATLLGYVTDVWSRIYTTSNDLPQQIKNQLKNFRTKVDFACDPSDKTTALNCLSAFVFLRFFCPAILNPKLFHLTQDHQVGNAQRTFTLVAKILLNLANRQLFTEHKEPHLMKMNQFLEAHEQEMLDYLDKLTGRKNDFNEKIMALSHEMKRFDMGLDGTSGELPTTPYLIDKYLRLTEFVHLVKHSGGKSALKRLLAHVASLGDVSRESPEANNGSAGEDSALKRNTNLYQIGTLEFEKSEFLDLTGDNETAGFIRTLCRSNENIFSFIKATVTMADLQKECTGIAEKIAVLTLQLAEGQCMSSLQQEPHLWEAFVYDTDQNGYLDTADNSIVLCDPHFKSGPGLKRLADGGLLALRIRFPAVSEGDLSDAFSAVSISGLLKMSIKNPLRRWLRRD